MITADRFRPSSIRRRRWHTGRLILALALIATGSVAVTQTPAIADPDQQPEAAFSSSFEADQTQPEQNTTVDSSGVVRGGKPGMKTVVEDGPDESKVAKTDVGFTGVQALQYAGRQTAKQRSYAYNKIFDVEIPVTADTMLSYKIFPALMQQDLSKGLPSPSSFVAVDLEFADGSHLRDLDAEDGHRFGLSAQEQGAAKVLYANQWNDVRSQIGKVAAGKTITSILLDYDNPTTGTGPFEGWLDDISIDNEVPPTEREHLSDWVVTNRGTNNNRDFSRGNNIPATAVPHAFNFWAPMTDAESFRWFYQYQEANNAKNFPEIQAFTLTHQGYPWGGERHTFQVMPSAGAGKPDPDRNARALAFSHENEVAKPHYYGVEMNNETKTEITPTDHGAMMRFSFTGVTSNLIFDNIDNSGGLTLDPDSGVLSGYTDFGTEPEHRMFVYATFDQPVTGGAELPGSGRPDVTGYYQFDTTEQKTVTMRIATSLISVDQAKHNLELELGEDTSFESIKKQAQQQWDDQLDVITDVEGATAAQLTSLYSNLYRLNLYPNSTFENAGTADDPEYKHASLHAEPTGKSTPTKTGAKIISGKSYKVSNFWDTYRTAWPADALFYPELTGELIDGALTQYTEGGWLDTAMVGSSSDVAFADAYAKGIDFDAETAYEAALKNGTVAPVDSSAGRPGLQSSIFTGYTSASTDEGLANALEDYLNDFGIAKMSEALAENTDESDPQYDRYRTQADYFSNRAQNYPKMFDPEVDFFQGRKDNGDFVQSPDEYDPREWGCDYTETNGWGMAFSVPHDGQGLANVYGDREQLEEKLDTFFSTPESAQFPGCYGDTIHEMLEAGYAQMGMFGISNQPGHHIPYMYNYVNPAKAQAAVRESLSRHFVGSHIGQGYLGDDDTGEMSAWYIFGALGFYPLQMGSDQYTIGSPLFTSATINLENGNEIVVNAPNNSPDNVFVQGLEVNGKSYDSTSISHEMLTDGAELTFEMGPEPSSWGSGDGAPPSLTTGDEVPNPLRDLTGPTRGTASSDAGNGNLLFDNTSNSRLTLTGQQPSVTWNFVGRSREKASHYTLTSGPKAGDPTGWVLEGSQNGSRWKTVDQRAGEQFQWRSQTRVFKIDKPKKYRHYRLRITGSSGGSAPTLAEIELLGKAPLDETVTADLTPEESLALPSDEPAERELTLNVTVDKPGASRVRVATEAPNGWTVEPETATIRLQSDGDGSATGTLPITVTMPAGTKEGSYPVAATAMVPGKTAVRAPATIQVTDSIEFSPGTRAESPWLFDDGNSQVDGEGNRFADGDNYFTYRFALPTETSQATATLSIDNQFRVEASSDGENWTEVLVEDREIQDGSNLADRAVDLKQFLGEEKTVYLKVSDSHPSDGWGGRVGKVSVTMS